MKFGIYFGINKITSKLIISVLSHSFNMAIRKFNIILVAGMHFS